jgi:hypothetical protein
MSPIRRRWRVGASAWHYVVGYRPDVEVAFAELQETVLAGGDYYGDEVGTFASMAELNEARHTEAFWEAGTHSVLDMMTYIGPDAEDDIAALRILRDDEVRALFGHDQPTKTDFERFIDEEWDIERWQGRATVLYQEGKPHELAFWGISGD